MLEALNSYEPELLTCSAPPAGVTEPAAKTLAMLADLYDRELVGVIGWAKQIPGFTELQLNDQVGTSTIMFLLKNCSYPCIFPWVTPLRDTSLGG